MKMMPMARLATRKMLVRTFIFVTGEMKISKAEYRLADRFVKSIIRVGLDSNPPPSRFKRLPFKVENRWYSFKAYMSCIWEA
jgi:hypothetical protein